MYCVIAIWFDDIESLWDGPISVTVMSLWLSSLGPGQSTGNFEKSDFLLYMISCTLFPK